MSKTSVIEEISKVEDCLIISGNFADDVTMSLINYINDDDYGLSINKKLSFLIAESFQNIVRHGYSKNQTLDKVKKKEGFYAIIRENGQVLLCSTNTLQRTKSNELQKQLEHLASLDAQELKAKYLDVLVENKTTEGGGAGLGLIEMMRKTEGNLYYYLNDVNVELCKANFDIYVPNKSQKIKPTSLISVNTKLLREKVESESILFLRKGLFNQASLLQLCDILEENFINTSQKEVKTHVFIFIEMIQNIFKHGDRLENTVEGVFLIKEHEEHLEYLTSNNASTDKAIALKERLNLLNGLSKDELKSLYLQKLKEGFVFSENLSGDIGLIEIIRSTGNPIKLEITQRKENSCRVTLSVNVQK